MNTSYRAVRRGAVATAFLVATALVLTACGSASKVSSTPAMTSSAPGPSAPSSSATAAAAEASLHSALSRAVPAGYLAQHLWRAPLSGGSVPEAIVSSVGLVKPQQNPEWQSFKSADLQVLTWDAIATRWTVVFDGQKFKGALAGNGSPGDNSLIPGADATDSSFPTVLLDPNADVQIGKVGFGKLLSGRGEQLVFGQSTNYGGSGAGGMLVVVDFQHGFGNVAYWWNGDKFDPKAWSMQGTTLQAQAPYWTPADAHCCASVTYRWSVRLTAGDYTLLADSRPWLGIGTRSKSNIGADAPLEVLSVVKGSPADRLLRKGDVITAVIGAPLPPHYADGLNDSKLYPQIARMHPGDIAHLRVQRGHTVIDVPIALGSLADASARYLGPFTWDVNSSQSFEYYL